MKTLLVTVSEITINNLKTGANIRRARLAAKVGLRELAERINIEPSRLSRLERGCGEWTRDLVSWVEEALR